MCRVFCSIYAPSKRGYEACRVTLQLYCICMFIKHLSQCTSIGGVPGAKDPEKIMRF